jgi:DnaJ domain
MFERTKIDNSTKNPVACELVLDDGREVLGHLLVGNLRGIIEELNAPGDFIEFEAVDRQRSYLCKQAIRSARSAAVAKVEPLDRRIREGVPFDPYVVLGVERTADRETIKRAYHVLAKAYHPDRMQAIDLPTEIVDYATAMAKRINAAYSALMSLSGATGSQTTGSQTKPASSSGTSNASRPAHAS